MDIYFKLLLVIKILTLSKSHGTFLTQNFNFTHLFPLEIKKKYIYIHIDFKCEREKFMYRLVIYLFLTLKLTMYTNIILCYNSS